MNDQLKKIIENSRKVRESYSKRFSRLGDILIGGTDAEFQDFIDEFVTSENDELLRENGEDQAMGGDNGITDD